MKIGLQIPDFSTSRGPDRLGAELATVARVADDAGFEYIAVMDHFFQIPAVGPAENEMLEGYTTLGYLAACTSRAALLTVITGVIYRDPGILAKIVTTLDVLSNGRAWLGIGAAWNEQESRGLGVSPVELIGSEVIPVVADFSIYPERTWPTPAAITRSPARAAGRG